MWIHIPLVASNCMYQEQVCQVHSITASIKNKSAKCMYPVPTLTCNHWLGDKTCLDTVCGISKPLCEYKPWHKHQNAKNCPMHKLSANTDINHWPSDKSCLDTVCGIRQASVRVKGPATSRTPAPVCVYVHNTRYKKKGNGRNERWQCK